MDSHARTRLKGDSKVNHAVNCTVERESQFTRKQSIAVISENTFENEMHMNAAQGVRPTFGEGWERERSISLMRI